jgi:hypothetical protein
MIKTLAMIFVMVNVMKILAMVLVMMMITTVMVFVVHMSTAGDVEQEINFDIVNVEKVLLSKGDAQFPFQDHQSSSTRHNTMTCD